MLQVRRLFGFVILTFLTPIAMAQTADKVVLGIGEITSSIAGSGPEGFQTMLETQLIKTNKFKIIERSRLTDLLGEQALSESGLIDSGQQLGTVEGVDYLIYGSITKLGRSGSALGIRGLSAGSNAYEMSVDLRIVDVETGEVRIADTVEEEVKSAGAFNLGGFKKVEKEGDPIGDVQRQTARSIAGLIVTNIFPPKVAAVQSNGTIIINYGDSVFAEGDYAEVYELGEGFTDPETGEVLGAEEIRVAVMSISETAAKYSKARLVEGEVVERGDVVRRMSSQDAKVYKKQSKKRKRKL